jgi:hypothetical protein
MRAPHGVAIEFGEDRVSLGKVLESRIAGNGGAWPRGGALLLVVLRERARTRLWGVLEDSEWIVRGAAGWFSRLLR